MADKKVGEMVHYYDKIGVAIIELTAPLKLNDTIKFVKGDQEFTQAVSSIEIDRQPVKSAKKGDSVGVKVDQPVKDGSLVYLTN